MARIDMMRQVSCLFPFGRVGMKIVEARIIKNDSITNHEGKLVMILKHTVAVHGEAKKS